MATFLCFHFSSRTTIHRHRSCAFEQAEVCIKGCMHDGRSTTKDYTKADPPPKIRKLCKRLRLMGHCFDGSVQRRREHPSERQEPAHFFFFGGGGGLSKFVFWQMGTFTDSPYYTKRKPSHVFRCFPNPASITLSSAHNS